MELHEQTSLQANILIVDDQPLCAEMLLRLLERAGYTRCTVMTDPAEAIDQYIRLNPDLILLDMHMEPMSGIDVLEGIEQNVGERIRPQILIMTGDTSAEAKHSALAAGATDFLAKPFDEIEVLLRIRNLLHSRGLYQRCQIYSHGLERLVEKRTEALQKNTRDLEQTIAELRETQHQLIQQERVRALGTMASGFAHDLNNGLSLIIGYGDIMLNDEIHFPVGSPFRRYLESVVRAGYDNAQLVRRLRDFYRPSDALADRLPLDLNAVIEQAISMTVPRWQVETQANGLSVEVVLKPGNIPLLLGAPAEFREVMTNLIFNAVDAMPRGGKITFSTGCVLDSVWMKMTDTGAGMDEETRARCFDPFFTTKGQGGSGLGLAMCQGIVARHGGAMTVESAVNAGTTFHIRLPIPASPVVPEQALVAASVQPLHILVVDDNAAICEVVAAYLEQEGHTVSKALSGSDALKKFTANPFHAVITDLAMPQMSGSELAARIKSLNPSEPIIMLTGFADVMRGAGQNADYLLKKPARLEDFRGALRKVTTRTEGPMAAPGAQDLMVTV